jgi:ankyrin repeat protein
MVLSLSHLAAGQAGSNSLDDQLIQAVGHGDTAAIQQLLEKGANIEAGQRYTVTPLMLAVENDLTEVAKLLLDKGANIEAKGGVSPYGGRTALVFAAISGDVEITKLLLDKRANIEARDQGGETALTEAADLGHTDVVKLLLEKGANIEAKNNDGYTALIEAASGGKADVVKLLLDKGANTEAKDDTFGETALLQATDHGKIEVVKLLLEKGANIEAKNNHGDTALIVAAKQRGMIEVVKLLLENGANVEAKNNDGYTALSWATSERDDAKLAVEKGWGNPTDSRKNLSACDELVQSLEHAVSKNPLAIFAEFVSDYQRTPYNEARREKVIKLAASLPTPPAIPEEARQLFLQASALMKQTSTPEELAKPIKLLRKALVIAPWWANAYYNLARALELSGHYDEAVKQLNYYLELKPSEGDATEARDHISVIQAEKEAAARKQQETVDSQAVKYVSGGATRVSEFGFPQGWKLAEWYRIETLYVYAVPQESPFYANAFRMPNGHILTITLNAQSNNGTYAGDQIGVWLWGEIEGDCHQGYQFAFGVESYTDACGVRYTVSVSNQPNAIITVTYTPTGASVTLPIALLYRGRALKSGSDSTGTVYQGGSMGVYVLHFDRSMVNAAEDPNVNAMGLTPTTVTPYKK